MKKEEFKKFAQNNPKLSNYVKNNEMTWQKFYEMYELYGEDSDIWNEYLGTKNKTEKNIKVGISCAALSDFINLLKNVDLDGLQEGISNIQRVFGVIQDFSKKEVKDEIKAYKPRPLYKHFED